MEIMDIASLSTYMSMSKLQNDIGTAVLSKVFEQVDVASEGMAKIMEASVNPGVGQNIDISVQKKYDNQMATAQQTSKKRFCYT